MNRFGQYRWFVLAGGITLAFAAVSLTVPRGPALTAISDIGYLLLYLALAVAMLANAWSERGDRPAVLGTDGRGKRSVGRQSGGLGLLRGGTPHDRARSLVDGCVSVSPPGSDDRGGWVASAPDRG